MAPRTGAPTRSAVWSYTTRGTSPGINRCPGQREPLDEAVDDRRTYGARASHDWCAAATNLPSRETKPDGTTLMRAREDWARTLRSATNPLPHEVV